MAADAPAPGPVEELARAKVNLTLHVTGRRSDGYHLLDSLVVFPEIGDLVVAEPAATLSLSVTGPFGMGLGTGGDNLVLRAAEGIGRTAALRLEKRLPVAAGLGGGSADAAAAVRALARLGGDAAPAAETLVTLGADVPVCLASRAARMRGIGERLSPSPPLPPHWLVLVNPGVPVPTVAVFGAMASRENPGMTLPEAGFRDLAAFAEWLAAQRNDLEPAALSVAPGIGPVLAALRAQAGARLVRMSGSGATCFGVFAGEATALAAAERLRAAEPGWWVAAGPVVR
ncbi:MAG: 4-(cytidine 5'-diphospho)-2-C-methyl-D-erythritol kinase [Pseudomonadota bacterium]